MAARLLAGLFALYGLVFAAFFAVNMPPFQNADEIAHVLRAAQIAQGGLIGARFGQGGSGGQVDAGLLAAYRPFDGLAFHPEAKASRAMFAPVGWSGQRIWVNFPNTSVYSPVFYLPAAAGLRVGQGAHLSILQSLTLARLGNALAGVLLGAAGIALSGLAAPWLFAVLCLPMSLALMANVSQDGVMLGACALAVGLLAQARRHPRPAWLAALALVLALLCMARPPYLPLAVLPLLLAGFRAPARLAASAAVVLACLAWSGFAAVHVMGVLRPDDPAIDPGQQIRWMAAHPGATAQAVLGSLRDQAATLLEQFIGRLGWLDTPLPAAYRQAAAWVLGLAALLSAGLPEGRRWAWLAAAVLASTAALYLIQYVTWNRVGSPFVEGVQGRYFLPLAVVCAGFAPVLREPPGWWLRLRPAGIAVLAVFPIVSLGVAMRAVILRYYL